MDNKQKTSLAIIVLLAFLLVVYIWEFFRTPAGTSPPYLKLVLAAVLLGLIIARARKLGGSNPP